MPAQRKRRMRLPATAGGAEQAKRSVFICRQVTAVNHERQSVQRSTARQRRPEGMAWHRSNRTACAHYSTSTVKQLPAAANGSPVPSQAVRLKKKARSPSPQGT